MSSAMYAKKPKCRILIVSMCPFTWMAPSWKSLKCVTKQVEHVVKYWKTFRLVTLRLILLQLSFHSCWVPTRVQSSIWFLSASPIHRGCEWSSALWVLWLVMLAFQCMLLPVWRRPACNWLSTSYYEEERQENPWRLTYWASTHDVTKEWLIIQKQLQVSLGEFASSCRQTNGRICPKM